jgi:glutamine synthetase
MEADGMERHDAILKILRKYIRETEPIRFEGNNYSKEWEDEAAKRGLANIKRTGYALDALVDDKNIEMLVRQNVLNKEEILGRYNTKIEQYLTALEIEVESLCDLINTKILPAAISFQSTLLNVVKGLNDLGDVIPKDATQKEIELLKAVSAKIVGLINGCAELKAKVQDSEKIEELPDKAKYFADNIVDMLAKVR